MKKSYLFLFILSLYFFEVHSSNMSDDTTHFVTTWRTSNPGLSNTKSITIATDERYEYNFDIDWNNDGIFDKIGVKQSVSHEYKEEGDYTLRIRGNYPRIAFEKSPLFPLGDQLKLLSVDQWGTNVWQDLSYAFAFCQNLKIFASDNPNLSEATNLAYLFANATYFMGDLRDWDVSSVSNMEGMFLNNRVFNSDLFEWYVSSVTNMKRMFQGAETFNQDLYYWDVGGVEDFSFMFKDALLFNGDISDWNVYNAENATGMFMGSTSFDRKFISPWTFSGSARKSSLYNGRSSGNFAYYGCGLGLTATIILEIALEVAFYSLLF